MTFAKKSLGQNFLIDKNIIDKISSLIEIEDQNILEVGPGTGNLTNALIKKKPKKFYVIEKDDTCLIQTLSGKLKIERTAISLEMSSKVNISSTKKN